jgi:hypothetical protein
VDSVCVCLSLQAVTKVIGVVRNIYYRGFCGGVGLAGVWGVLELGFGLGLGVLGVYLLTAFIVAD